MERIEDRLRASLHQRAHDVEPTPALWRSVEARISRHRRGIVLSWSLATAAAAVVALAVVPSVLQLLDDGSSGPSVADTPEIAEAPGGLAGELTPGASLPAGVVLAEGEQLTLLELPSGERSELPGPGRELLDVAVRPGTAADEGLEVAYAAVAGDADDRAVIGVLDADGRDTTLGEVPRTEATAPSVVWHPEGEWLAWTGAREGGSWIHTVEVARPAHEHDASDEGTAGYEVQPGQIDRDGVLGPGLRLDDWFGYDHDGSTAASLLVGTHPDRDAVSLPTQLAPSGGSGPQILDAIAEHGSEGLLTRVEAAPDRAGGVTYELLDDGEALDLAWLTPEDDEPIEGESLPLPGDLDAAPTTIDALGDAVALGDGERAWLVTHDGAGGDARVAELGPASALSMVRDGGDRQETDEQAEGDEDADQAAPDPIDDAEWSTPLLTTDAELGSTLALLDADTGASRELVTLDAEGEAYLQAVAVEPGSTPDDLTAAVLAFVEGTYELRVLQVDEDGVDCCRPLPAELQVDTGGPVPIDGERSIPLPVWSPSGDVLAWVESAEDTHWLRTVAWDGDGPVDDPDAHRRIDLGALGVEREVALQDWVEQERTDGETRAQVYFTGIEMERSAIIELPVTSRGGVVEVTDDAFVMGTDVARLAVDHAPAVAGLEPDALLEDPAAARVTLEWTPGSGSWLTFGREIGAVQLPDDHGEGLDLEQRPWLEATSDGGAVTGVGGARYLVSSDGEVTPIAGSGDVGVTHADLVD